jgi:hypothetical protein
MLTSPPLSSQKNVRHDAKRSLAISLEKKLEMRLQNKNGIDTDTQRIPQVKKTICSRFVRDAR